MFQQAARIKLVVSVVTDCFLSGDTLQKGLGATFTEARYFDLRYNFLNGSLPEVSNLHPSTCKRLPSAAVCKGFGNMTKLNHLVLANNLFTDSGGLARIVANMPDLAYIDVRSNQMTGPAPAALCQCTNLTYCGLVDPKYHTNSFADVPACLRKACIISEDAAERSPPLLSVPPLPETQPSFVPFQTLGLPHTGGYGLEAFEIDGVPYIAVANFFGNYSLL